MKKFICIALSLVIITCLFSGCKAGKKSDDTSANGMATTDNTTEMTEETTESSTQQTTESTTEETTETTQETTESTPPPTTESTKPPATESTTPPATESTTPPATDPPAQDLLANVNLIAGGKWDGGPVKWGITEDGVLIFTGYNGIQGKQTYPWHDYADIVTKIVFAEGITRIPKEAFREMDKVESIEFGSTVSEIGEEAFFACKSLKSITLGKDLKLIGNCAFIMCTNLESISFPSDCKLEEIGDMAFSETGLREFNAPASLRKISYSAFANCKKLESVRLEGGVNTLLAKAFQGCTELKHLVLGASLTRIDGLVFDGCKAITTLEYSTNQGVVFTNLPKLTTLVIGGNRTKTGCFSGCTSLSSVTITADITKIDDSAFRECSSLTSITFPSTLETIGMSAFRDSGVQELIFTGDAPQGAWQSAFTNVTATIYFPAENQTWNGSIRQNYGGRLTWVAQ